LNDTTPPDWVEDVKKQVFRILFPKDQKNKGVPLSLEEARALDRPSQDRKFSLLENDAVSEVIEKMKIFLKTESMDPATAPRIIANPDDHLRTFSRMFGVPLSDYLKNQTPLKNCYGFKSPAELKLLVERVVAQARAAPTYKSKFDDIAVITEDDFSKMDATINAWQRQMEKEVGLEFFAQEYHELWRLFHSKCYANPDSKKLYGVSVKLACSRRSGEFYTSIFNTFENWFYNVCVHVFMGATVEQAIECVGAVGGDDGLHAHKSTKASTEVASLLGFIVKADVKTLSDPVSFLGLVRFDEDCYVYDPRRFVSKFSSSSTGSNVPWKEVAYRKFEPYAKMYPHVPLIGTASRAVLRCLRNSGFKGPSEKYDFIARGMSGFIVSQTLGGEPMMDCTTDQGRLFGYIADRLGITVAMLETIDSAYKNAKSFKDFPSHVLSVDRKEFKYPTMFQGNIYAGGNAPAEKVDNTASSAVITRPGTSLTSRTKQDASSENKQKKPRPARKRKGSDSRKSESGGSSAGDTSDTSFDDWRKSQTQDSPYSFGSF